jgi:uncharacterized caspase-like protein
LTLNYALGDATGVADYFSKNGSRLFSSVNVVTLYDDKATAPNILSAFADLQQKAQPQDVVVIYFAGHGDTRVNDWYFVPYDVVYPERDEELTGKGLSSTRIAEELGKMKAQKILMILDSCRSGSAVTAFRGYEDRRSLAQLARSAGIHVIAASNATQLAQEVSELGHGVFTYTVLKGLEGQALIGPTRKDITVRGLLAYVEGTLPELSMKYRTEAQYPVSSSKGMDFPVAILP